MRSPVVGRKNFNGSGFEASADLADTMYSVFATMKLWGLNLRTWLTTYLPREVAEHALSHHLPNAVERSYQRETQFAMRKALMDDWAAQCKSSVDSNTKRFQNIQLKMQRMCIIVSPSEKQRVDWCCRVIGCLGKIFGE